MRGFRFRIPKFALPLCALIAISISIVSISRAVSARDTGEAAARANHLTSLTPGKSLPAYIKEVDRSLTPENSMYVNTERAGHMLAELQRGAGRLSQSDRWGGAILYARELINAGQYKKGVDVYGEIFEQIKTEAPQEWARQGPRLLVMRAIGNLRLGEVENCCNLNNSQSCLIPISGAGIHSRPMGSHNALKDLEAALALSPSNMQARWLLNIAHMTLGTYPGGIPKKWLIPIEIMGGTYPMKRFYNGAHDLGLDFEGWAGGIAVEDFDGDNLLDLVITSIRPGGQMHYYRNEGNGKFTDRTKEAGLIGETGGLNLVVTDYNNDGRPDIVVLRGGWFGKSGHYPLSLLRNDGNGHFTDVTIEAGLLTFGPTQTAAVLDYNGDGNLDLFVGYETSEGDRVPCKLFRNEGNGKFTDVTESCCIHVARFVKAAIAADYLHSGRPGLYLSCSDGRNILLRNDGPSGPDRSPKSAWKFTDVSSEAGVDKQNGSFSCFFFDYDNDGWLDIYVGGYSRTNNAGDVASDYLGLPSTAEKAKLYRNNRNGTFSDITREAGLDKVILGMGLNVGDLDNDGWQDFYAATGNPDLGMLIPNRMFRNRNGKCFDEVTKSGGFGHLQKGHGVSFADINNDGQQDVFVVMGGAFEGDSAHDCLFVNPGHPNHWVTLTLEGVRTNRMAFGAEICVTVSTSHGERKIYRTVGTGGSFGNNPLRQEIGLGDALEIRAVDIRWPSSGTQQTVRGVGMDGFYKIMEGATVAQRYETRHFKLPGQSVTQASNTGAPKGQQPSP